MTELYDNWIAALRSGDYKQTQNRLRSSDDAFCCLGVACDTYNPDLWERQYYLGAEYALPLEVLLALGLSPDCDIDVSKEEFESIIGREVSNPLGNVSLFELNDEYGLNFNQIADVLEKYRDQFTIS